ncbi:MAG: ATP-binding cassette, subfamily bacterial [Mycobacteriales bacterium]
MPSTAPRTSNDILARGLRVLGAGIREQKAIFAVAVAGGALFGGMTVASAFVLGGVTTRTILPAFAAGRTTAGALAGAALAILGVALVKVVGIVGRRVGAGTMQYRLQASYRRRITRQYLTLPLSWHQRHPTGTLLSNANADVESTWYPIAPLPFACGAVVMLGITVVALVRTDPALSVVGLVVFPAVFTLNFVYSRRMSPRMTHAQQLRAEVSGVAHESFDGALVVKTLGREQEETDRFRRQAVELRDAMVRVGRLRGTFDPMMEALPTFGTLAVLLVGTMRLRSGAATVGDLVSVAYLFTVLALPVRAIGWVLGDLPRAVVGWDRVQRVLRASGGQAYGDRVLPARSEPARLSVDQVTFGYAEGAPPVLIGVGFDVAPGSTVAVVGPTGSGKSTLVTLLVRLVDPQSGSVLLDGADLRELSRGGVSDHTAIVSQATFLFDDTVRGNVTLGADMSDEQVWRALAVAQADRFVRALPDGLATRVGERGTSLSGGQRQRIALARALARRPRLLVLDDATSSVDPAVEAAILRGLRSADLHATVVVVAYRRSTIALADEVVFLERGRVLGRGSHQDLLATTPGYARLVLAYEEAEQERRRNRAALAAGGRGRAGKPPAKAAAKAGEPDGGADADGAAEGAA